MCAFVFLKLFLENWGIKCNTEALSDISIHFLTLFVHSYCLKITKEMCIGKRHLTVEKYGNFLVYKVFVNFLHSYIQFQCHLKNSAACSLSKKALSGKPSKVSFAEKKDEIGFQMVSREIFSWPPLLLQQCSSKRKKELLTFISTSLETFFFIFCRVESHHPFFSAPKTHLSTMFKNIISYFVQF